MSSSGQKNSLIDENFYVLIGEVVVKFGQLEDELRFFVSNHVSPGIETWISLGLFSRTRFAELVEMYELVVGYAIQEAQGDARVTPGGGAEVRTDLRNLCKELSKVNDRRNTVVHSAYFEEEFQDRGGRVLERTLSALKPNRKALDLKEDFNPFQDIHSELRQLLIDLEAVGQHLVTFDFAILPHVNALWESFALRVIELREKGFLEKPGLRLQFPGLRIS
jgi:hypothetical protein